MHATVAAHSSTTSIYMSAATIDPSPPRWLQCLRQPSQQHYSDQCCLAHALLEDTN